MEHCGVKKEVDNIDGQYSPDTKWKMLNEETKNTVVVIKVEGKGAGIVDSYGV
jgi:hypothetical protein